MSALSCDECGRPAEFTLTAAYDADGSLPHPTVACYPAPMVRACRVHLCERVAEDRTYPGASPFYVLHPLGGTE